MRKFLLMIAASAVATIPVHAGLVFNFTAASSNVPPAAMTAVALAGQRWSAVLSNNITVNISVDFTNQGGTSIANATFSSIISSYSSVISALNTKATTPDDAIAKAHLQAGSAFNFLISDPDTGDVVLDKDNSKNNTNVRLTYPNAKALGLLTATLPGDGTIKFNSSLPFDFDPSNGIDSNKVDFVSDATHEIGHILGFDSAVDSIDTDTEPKGAFAPGPVSSVIPFTLDLFRYSSDSAAQGIEDLSPGGTKYLSLDGGATSIAQFSTGVYNGDGFQPEHWKHGLNLGVMDPAFSFGQTRLISANDIRAMDAIGFTAVPEPSSVVALLLLALPLANRRRA